MAALADESKIFKPYVHSLAYMAAVKVAAPLCNNFDSETLHKALFNIRDGISVQVSEDPLTIKCNKAQNSLLCIPPLLRKAVVDTAVGLNRAAHFCRIRNPWISWTKPNNFRDCFFYWKSDGTVDRIKTAQQLVHRTDIDTRERFLLACEFCFEKDVQTLWAELEESGQTKKLESSSYTMEKFWARRMRKASQAPWKQDGKEFFEDPRNNFMGQCYSTFFPLFKPGEREKFFDDLRHSVDEDFMLCLYVMSKEEEDRILQKTYCKILRFYFQSSLRILFPEIVEKLWKYVKEDGFSSLLQLIFKIKMPWEDIDYYEIFERIWYRSPILWRERLIKSPYFIDKIEYLLYEIKRNRGDNVDDFKFSFALSEARNKKRLLPVVRMTKIILPPTIITSEGFPYI